MQDMQTKIIERYFFFGLLFATLIFAFLLFKPFWVVLILGISFSIIIAPLYEWLHKRGLPRSLASLLTVICFTVILLGPLLGLSVLIFNQSESVYHAVVSQDSAKPFLDKVDNAVKQLLPQDLVFDVHERVAEFISYLSGNISNIFKTTISAFFSFLLMLLIMFYILKDGDRWRKAVVILSPLSDADDEKIIHRLREAVRGVILGNLFVALIQGVLMGVGLWLFGVPNGALWGMVAAVFSLLPTFGTAFVSVPAIIFLIISGQTAQAVGLLAWSALAVGMIDNVLSPFIIGGKTHIPPLLILFAVLGGIALAGPVGILVGPLAISLLYTLISIYRHEFRQTTAF